MSDTYQIHERLMEVERAARGALYLAIDTPEGSALREALRALDQTRSAIAARQKLEGRYV